MSCVSPKFALSIIYMKQPVLINRGYIYYYYCCCLYNRSFLWLLTQRPFRQLCRRFLYPDYYIPITDTLTVTDMYYQQRLIHTNRRGWSSVCVCVCVCMLVCTRPSIFWSMCVVHRKVYIRYNQCWRYSGVEGGGILHGTKDKLYTQPVTYKIFSLTTTPTKSRHD